MGFLKLLLCISAVLPTFLTTFLVTCALQALPTGAVSSSSTFLQIPKVAPQPLGEEHLVPKGVYKKSVQQLIAEFLKLLKSNSWNKFRKLATKSLANRELTLDEIEMVAVMKHSQLLIQAVNGARGLVKLGKKANLDQATAFSLALFLERILAATIHNHGTYYFEKGQFDIERDIQIDPKSAQVYIHLGLQAGVVKKKSSQKRVKRLAPSEYLLGSGQNKRVYKAVVYDSFDRVEMAAVAVANGDTTKFKAWKALNGKPGILNFFSILDLPLKAGNGKKQVAIFTPCFTPGSVSELIASNIKLTFKEKVGIARDAMLGLASMHEEGYVHRNIDETNVLTRVRTSDGVRRVVSVLGGLTHALSSNQLSSCVTHVSGHLTAPEMYSKKNPVLLDYIAGDLYAMGEVCWHLLFGKASPWISKAIYRAGSKRELSLLKKRRLEAMSLGVTKAKKEMKKLSILEQQFFQVILNLISPDPQARGTARLNYEQLEKIYTAL